MPTSSPLRAQDGPAATTEAIILHNTHRYEKAFLVRACRLSEEQRHAVDKLDDSWQEAVSESKAAADRQMAQARIDLMQRPQQAGVVEAAQQIGDARMIAAARVPIKKSVADDLIHKYR